MLAPSRFLLRKFNTSSTNILVSVYCSEIFPTWMRAQGVGFSLLGLFGGTLIYTQPATTAIAAIGWKYYLRICVRESLLR